MKVITRYLYKAVAAFCLLLCLVNKVNAQPTITGSSCTAIGPTYRYSINPAYETDGMIWCVPASASIVQVNGNITSTNGNCITGNNISSIYVQFNTTAGGNIDVFASSATASVYITVVNALTPGAISSNGSQSIDYNSVPATIGCSAATYGSCSPTYLYQWLKSVDGTGYTPIAGATSQNLSFSQPLLQTTYYKRQVTEAVNNATAYSDIATVNVTPPFSSVTVSPSVQDVFAGDVPSQLTGGAATGGSCGGSYTYQWESSTDGGTTFQSINGATGLSYQPGSIGTARYRRKDMCGSQLSFSNTVAVNVYQHLTPGVLTTASLVVSYNTDPGYLPATDASGGICALPAVQWQTSIDGTSFTDIAGATSYIYKPGLPAVTAYYRRRAQCGAETVYTNTMLVTVNPWLDPGAVFSRGITIAANSSPGLLKATASKGGNCGGSFSYQWQQSTDDNIYSDITGATGADYTPGSLSASVYFRRKVTCGIDIGYTDRIHVVVGNPPTASNYVQTRVFSKPVTDITAAGQLANLQDVNQVTSFFDGLGRPSQTVNRQFSTGKKDLVSMNTYDAFGRETIQFLPYVSTGNQGGYKTNAFTEQNTFNATQFPQENYYFSQTILEPSPLGRPQASYAQGQNWIGAGRGVTSDYLTNTAIDAVRIWQVTEVANTFGTYTGSTFYNAGELYKNINTDEHGKQTIEFKDKDGQVILKKVQLTAAADNAMGSGYSGWLCTYYIYDDLNRLRAVIQPKGVELLDANNWNINALSNAILDEQCFRYEYDYRDRMILKKVPGAGEVAMIYDKRDRLVFTQDAVQRVANQWYTIFYDELNRQVCTALMTKDISQASLQQLVTLRTTASGLNFPKIPVKLQLVGNLTGTHHALQRITLTDGFISTGDLEAGIVNGPGGATGEITIVERVAVNKSPLPDGAVLDVLTNTFYDDYDWQTEFNSGLGATLNTDHSTLWLPAGSNFPYPQTIAASGQLKGLVTGTRTKILGTDKYLYTANFYDEWQRLIQTQSTNHTGGKDVMTTQYSFNGKPLLMVQHQQKGQANPQTITVCTRYSYDDLWRVVKMEKKTAHSLINGGAWPSDYTVISEISYDALGQLKTKSLGRKKDANGIYTSTPLETELMDYNIRGWLLGLNRDYTRDANTNHYFGFDLGYDKAANGLVGNNTYTSPQYNGNIAGMVWKSRGDGEKRKYDFTYDGINRLTGADFNQYTGTAFDKTAGIDFSVSNLGYDANGNILGMTQKGLLGVTSVTLDALSYSYQQGGNSNKLLAVTESPAISITDHKLGDFTDKNRSMDDYDYDANGNLRYDKNKDIASVTYNHLNLPSLIAITGRGTIVYTYDANGNKLSKTVTDYTTTPQKVTTTLYMGGAVYENDVLQFTGHEEGRTRFTAALGNAPAKFDHDYFLQDHLGNVRMVLTDQQQQDVYPAATLEGSTSDPGSAVSVERQYYQINPAQIVTRPDALTENYANNNGNPPYNNNPNSEVTAISQRLYDPGAGSSLIGPGIALKVMSGDQVDVLGRSFYSQPAPPSGTMDFPVAVSAVLDMFLATGPLQGKGLTESSLSSGVPGLLSALSSYLQDHNNGGKPGRPLAYINWIFFDEQFRYAGGGYDRVTVPNVVKTHTIPTITAPKNGYIFVYCSNETVTQPVFFDNLQVIHTRGPVLEETHYYPFGLTMAGISSKALGGMENKTLYNGNELQNEEFSDGSGLEMYDFNARTYDAQIGRFLQMDPEVENGHHDYTPYAFTYNNPVSYTDPFGRDTLPSGKHIYDKGADEELAQIRQDHPEGMLLDLDLSEQLYLLGEQLLMFALPEGKLATATSGTEKTIKNTEVLTEDVALGMDLTIKGKPNWTAAQNEQAADKAKSLTEAETVVTKDPIKRDANTRSKFIKAGGQVNSTEHVDHVLDLQLGGSNALTNLKALDGSVNSSFGRQIQNQIRNVPDATKVNKVVFIPRVK